MKNLKSYLVALFLITCTATFAQENVNYAEYKTKVDIVLPTITGAITEMENVELRVIINCYKELIIFIDRWPEGNGLARWFSYNNGSYYITHPAYETPEGYRRLILGHNENGNELAIGFIRSNIGDFYDMIFYVSKDFDIDRFFRVKLTDQQFSDIFWFVTQNGKKYNCIRYWNPNKGEAEFFYWPDIKD